jgi:predicted RNase H-like HicB family nuclease
MAMKIKVQLIEEEGGGFTVVVPGLPGCMSQGETEDEALANITELIPAYLEAYSEENAKTLPNIKEILVAA